MKTTLVALIILLVTTTAYAGSGRDIGTECRSRCTYKIPNLIVSYTVDYRCFNECYVQVTEEIRQEKLDTAIIANLEAETALMEQQRRELRRGNRIYRD